MASLLKKGDSFYCQFYHLGRRFTVTIGEVGKAEAEDFAGSVGQLMRRIKQKLVRVPAGVSITDFVVSGGQATPIENAAAAASVPTSFAAFREKYLDTHRGGSMEQNSLKTAEMHLRHFERTLGEKFELRQLTLADLQRHVSDRVRKTYRGKRLSPVTLKKEIATFRAAWNWAALTGLVQGPFPSKGLVYPKGDEKPPFMTWAEIERRGTGLDEREREALWECLFLQQKEITELLSHVRESGSLPWVYPAVCFAAHTGARRSEVLRVRLQDLDLDAGHVMIREKKRARGTRTQRRVPLSPVLSGVLRECLTDHPGGPFLFCQAGVVARSKKRSRTTGHKDEKSRETSLKGRMATVRRRAGGLEPAALTRDEAHDHLRRSLARSKWEVLKGWHVLRHSFISNCAAKGVDQRLIDSWVGHTTEEMRKRYRHLIPNVEQAAIRTVFE